MSLIKSLTEQIVKEFILCTLPKEKWTHHAHLKVGLWHLIHYSPVESMDKIGDRLKKYNVSCGTENTETQGYHETNTQFYVLLINRFVRQVHNSQSIDLLANELISS